MVINSLDSPIRRGFRRDGARRAAFVDHTVLRVHISYGYAVLYVCTVVSDGGYIVDDIVTSAGYRADNLRQSHGSWNIRTQVATNHTILNGYHTA